MEFAQGHRARQADQSHTNRLNRQRGWVSKSAERAE
jgi:hypothetical protein